jgi:hypothetical protein
MNHYLLGMLLFHQHNKWGTLLISSSLNTHQRQKHVLREVFESFGVALVSIYFGQRFEVGQKQQRIDVTVDKEKQLWIRLAVYFQFKEIVHCRQGQHQPDGQRDRIQKSRKNCQKEGLVVLPKRIA